MLMRRRAKGAIALVFSLGVCLILLNSIRLKGMQPAHAQSSLLDSKVARLEFVVQNLELSVRQLSAQASTTSPPQNPARISQPASAQERSSVSRQAFENLTTLVLELKEDVRALEKAQGQRNRDRGKS